MTPAEFDAAKRRNERWIREKKAQGYTIYDIGLDPNRVGGRSPFYALEKDILGDFPVTPLPGF
jgi:hypothetical protein